MRNCTTVLEPEDFMYTTNRLSVSDRHPLTLEYLSLWLLLMWHVLLFASFIPWPLFFSLHVGFSLFSVFYMSQFQAPFRWVSVCFIFKHPKGEDLIASVYCHPMKSPVSAEFSNQGDYKPLWLSWPKQEFLVRSVVTRRWGQDHL